MICTRHNIPMKALFTSFYCDKCDNKTLRAVKYIGRAAAPVLGGHTISIEGTEFVAMGLSGPEAMISRGDPSWDYAANPIGPGTMGYGKSQEEIYEMTDRWIVIRSDNGLMDEDYSKWIAYMVHPSGVYHLDPTSLSGGSLIKKTGIVDDLEVQQFDFLRNLKE